MKNKFLITGVFSLASVSLFAQKNELTNAQTQYSTYETARGQKMLAKQAETSIASAKTSIDKAAVHEKTATLPQTYALKAAIYGALAYQDTTYAAGSQANFTTAEEALKKAKQADTKAENASLIKTADQYLGIYSLNKGAREYQDKKYDLAYKSFDFYRTINPEDTTAVLYTGLAAVNAKNYPAAISNYKKLAGSKYSKAANVYSDLANIYLESKDTVNAMSTLAEGVTKYPTNSTLRNREIDLSIQQGKQREVMSKLQSAIANDPKNKSLYYYNGQIYSNIALEMDKKITATKVPTAKAALLKSKRDTLAKAAEFFQKAVDIDPNFSEALESLGFALITPGVDDFNAANALPSANQKEYVAMMAKSVAQIEKAKPFLLKAVELNPKSQYALVNLRNYYIIKKDTANAAAIKKQIDAL